MTQKYEAEEVVWTETLSDRRLRDRRNGIDRRDMTGQALYVPSMRTGEDRRVSDRRDTVTLVITGRPMLAGYASDDV